MSKTTSIVDFGNDEVYNEYTRHQDAILQPDNALHFLFRMNMIWHHQSQCRLPVRGQEDDYRSSTNGSRLRNEAVLYQPYGIEVLRWPCQLVLGSPPCCSIQAGFLWESCRPASLGLPCTFFPGSQRTAVSNGFVSPSPILQFYPSMSSQSSGPSSCREKWSFRPMYTLYLMAGK